MIRLLLLLLLLLVMLLLLLLLQLLVLLQGRCISGRAAALAARLLHQRQGLCMLVVCLAPLPQIRVSLALQWMPLLLVLPWATGLAAAQSGKAASK